MFETLKHFGIDRHYEQKKFFSKSVFTKKGKFLICQSLDIKEGMYFHIENFRYPIKTDIRY